MDSKQIIKILKFGSKEEKINTLEPLSNSSDSQIVNMIITKLDDSNIEVRGEAFSSLVLNENNITKNLVASLNSESKNIRGFSALVLANRKNYDAISSIIPLTKDERSMVRACALGALGHLKANDAKRLKKPPAVVNQLWAVPRQRPIRGPMFAAIQATQDRLRGVS